jgi:hypothetical protein
MSGVRLTDHFADASKMVLSSGTDLRASHASITPAGRAWLAANKEKTNE